MGIIREPKNVDFSIKSIPWEMDELSEFRVIMSQLKEKNKKIYKPILKKLNSNNKKLNLM